MRLPWCPDGCWRRAGRAVVVAVAVAVGAGGCGVPLDSEPQAISPEGVPYDLLERATTTTSTTTTLLVATVDVPVYFVRNSLLVETQRAVTQSPSVNKAVNALLVGPDDAEEAQGIRSAISPELTVEVGRVEQGVVTINLGSGFSRLSGNELQLAQAQLVWTATGIAGVTGVRFTLDGSDIEVRLPDASLVTGPVGREAFAPLCCAPAS